MNKLKNKLIQLTESKRLEYWNGHSIKRSRVGNSDSKTFQVNKVKYKLELEAESRCDNTTNFIPTEPKPILHDWRQGRYYTGYGQISEFLGLPVEDVVEIWEPLLEQSKFNNVDIGLSILQYQSFLVEFNKMFCLD